MRKKMLSKVFAVATVAVLTLAMCVPVGASSTDKKVSNAKKVQLSLVIDKSGSNGESSLTPTSKLTEVEQESGNISISLSDGKSGTSKEGVEFTCTRVADVVDGEYVLNSEYKSSGVNLNKIKNASDLESASTTLANVAGTGDVLKTDANGKLTFSDVAVGVYLIKASNDDNYDEVTPLLVSIPTWSEDEGGMMYDVNVIPKHTPRPDENKPGEPGSGNGGSSGRGTPQTSVDSNILWYFGGAVVLIVVAVAVNVRWKKKKD